MGVSLITFLCLGYGKRHHRNLNGMSHSRWSERWLWKFAWHLENSEQQRSHCERRCAEGGHREVVLGAMALPEKKAHGQRRRFVAKEASSCKTWLTRAPTRTPWSCLGCHGPARKKAHGQRRRFVA